MTPHCPHCQAALSDAAASECPLCHAARPEGGFPHDERVGEVVAGGQYRVIRRLGSGGFGTVYEIATVVGDLRRAMKVLARRWASDVDARKRFVDEALMLEQIHHPNVARCYAAGNLEDGAPYLLFELIDGPQLAQLVARGPLEPIRAVRLARQIAAGLAAAHAAQVLHRDLKPENILVTDPGSRERVKVVDFGIAKMTEEGRAETQNVVGTPEYMAPEQFMPGTPLDGRVDLWQLGAVLFAMLTGRAPYRAETGGVAAIFAQQQSRMELGPAPSEIEATLARYRGLDQLVARLLATDPGRRPSHAAEVCDELALLEHRLAPDAGRGGSETLLGALCATPSESAWIALHGWLLGQPDRHEALVGTATRMLDHWPPGLRRAPLASWESTRRGTEHPLWPLVRSLDLSARGLGDEEVARLAASPSLRSITHLDLSNNEIGNAGLAALADSPHLGALEHLDLSHNRFGSTGLEALVTRGAMRGLRALRVAHNGIGARGAEALVSARIRLFELDLSGNELGSPGARALADAESLAGLRVLKLSQAKLGPDGVAALAVSPHLAHLQALELALNGIGASGAAALALTSNARGLRRLDLSRNGLGREGLQLLLASQHLDDLRELDLSGNALGATGAMLLASAPFVRRLERLIVSDDQLGDAGVAALLGSPHLGGLRALAIAQNEVTASGASLLSSAPPQLESLDLSLNPLGDAGAEAAAEALRRLRIETLRVAGASLGANGVAALLRAGRLLALDASQNAIGPDGALRLANAVGGLEELALAACNLGPRGARALLGAPGRLRDLDLASNALGDDGATALVAAAPNLSRLERLNLADDAIGADGAEALAVSSLATHVRELSLADGGLGDAGAEALARGRAWHALRVLDLRGNGISLAGASALAGSPSLAMLERLTLSSHVLTSDLDVHSLAPAKAERMEETFAEVASMGVDFAEQFYDELFARFPTVKPLFAKVTMARQHQHLLSALALVVDNLREPDRVEQALMELGARHWGYGTVPTHYQAVVATLLDVLRDALGDRWDETAHEAWSDGLRAVANVMMRSGRPTPEGLATEPTRRGAAR